MIKKSYGSSSNFYYDQGIALYEVGRTVEAEASFRKAIQLNPKFAWAYCNLAGLLDEMERHQEALKTIDRAISLDPHDSDFRERRSEIQANLRKHGQKFSVSSPPDSGQHPHESVQEDPQKIPTLDDCITDLIQEIKDGEVAVFCGAGISKNSGLPDADQLAASVLGELESPAPKIEGLPFEAFIQIRTDYTNIDPILYIFDIGRPNANHIFLAKLFKMGLVKNIITTNFDCLIENALEDEGWKVGNQYDLIYRTEELESVNRESRRQTLVKIHGSIHDKESLAATIRDVAGKLFSKGRKKAVDNIFSLGPHKSVLMLGYSCSDLFDLSPQIEAIQTDHKKVVMVNHTGTSDSGKWVEDIRIEESKNPFRNFETGFRLHYNTDELVKILWHAVLPPENVYAFRQGKTCWFNKIKDWHSESLSKDKVTNLHLILGRLLFDIGKMSEAKNYFIRALRQAQKIPDKKGEGWPLSLLGSVCSSLGHKSQSLQYYKSALAIAQTFPDEQLEADCLCGLGMAHGSQDPTTAIGYLDQGLAAAERNNDLSRKARILGNLGGALASMGQYGEAIQHLENGVSISEEIGDLAAAGQNSVNLGLIHSRLGKRDAAVSRLKKSLDTFRKFLGPDHSITKRTAITLKEVQTWSVEDDCGIFGQPMNKAKLELSRARNMGNKREETVALLHLGHSLLALLRYEEALAHYSAARQISRDLGDGEREADCIRSMGYTNMGLGRYQAAIECFEDSLNFLSGVNVEKMSLHSRFLKRELWRAKKHISNAP